MPVFELPRVGADSPIVMDAVADEAAWGSALVIPQLVTATPKPGQAPTGTTVVRVFSTGDTLYVSFEVTDPEPERVRAGLGRRDGRGQDDSMAIAVDPAGDGQRAYLFRVTPLGIQVDGLVGGDGDLETAWDASWSAAAHRTPTGWSAELGIPWSVMRHAREVDHVGIMVDRLVARSNERSTWPATDPSNPSILAQLASIHGPGALPRSQGGFVQPEATFGWGSAGPAAECPVEGLPAAGCGAPPDRYGYYGISPGLTAGYSPAPQVSLLATLNPDFSEIEGDSQTIDVNRRYARQFEEKRPFFLDGQEWFTTVFPDVSYTRSIQTPRYGLRGTFEPGGWRVGVIHALDGAPPSSVSEGGGWTDSDLEGAEALATMVSVRRSVGDGGYVGGLLSDRTIVGSATPLANRLGTVETAFNVGDHAHIEGAAVASQTELATGATPVAPAAMFSADYETKNLEFWTWNRYISPDFHAENGFNTRVDLVGTSAGVTWTTYPSAKVMPSLAVSPLNASATWTTLGVPRGLWLESEAWATLPAGGDVGITGGYGGERYADTWFDDKWQVEAEGGADLTRWLSFWLWGSESRALYYDEAAPFLGQDSSAGVWLRLQPVPAVTASTSIDAEWFNHDGVEVYSGFVGREKIEVFLTRSLWVRVIADRSTFDALWTGTALLAWEPAPRNAAYLGGSYSDDGSWGLVAKVERSVGI